MGRRATSPDLFLILKSVSEALSSLESAFKQLKKRRLVDSDQWKTVVRPAISALAKMLDAAWADLQQKASRQAFPDLIREDQVQDHFQISHQTLYRRRKNRELPYIRDKEGIIWYPVFDLLDYVLKMKVSRIDEKRGRPRKF